MERIDGGTVPSPFVFDPYGEHAEALGRQFFTTLGKLAALNHEGTPIREVAPAPAPEDCWRIALDHWSGVIEADEQHPQPIVRAAIRWLYRHPPPRPSGCVDRPWRLPHRQLHARRGRDDPGASSTGRWPIWAIRSRTWAGPSTRCGTTSTRARSRAWFPSAEAIALWEAGQRAEGRSRGPGLVVAVQRGEGPGDLDLGGQANIATAASSIRSRRSRAGTRRGGTT